MRQLLLHPEGTLLDTSSCLEDALRFALGVLGCERPIAVERTPFPPVNQLLDALGPERSRELPEACLLCADYYLERVRIDARPYAGASEMLDRLRARGVRVSALVDRPWLQPTLERCKLGVDELLPLRGRSCPQGRQALVAEGLLAGRIKEDCAWLSDCPLELRLASELGVEGYYAAYGRFGESHALLPALNLPGARHLSAPRDLVDCSSGPGPRRWRRGLEGLLRTRNWQPLRRTLVH